jgi:hypothetical protein
MQIHLPLLMLVRRIIGAICVAIGILGLLMPILPGWPFLIPGIALLGTRDPILRTLYIWIVRLLKWVRRRKTPWLAQLGERLFVAFVKTRDTVTPLIVKSEKALERWFGVKPPPTDPA